MSEFPYAGTPAEKEDWMRAHSKWPPHPCFWCGEETWNISWACFRCIPLKEEGYRRAREANAQGLGEVYPHVWDVLEENGIRPVEPKFE